MSETVESVKKWLDATNAEFVSAVKKFGEAEPSGILAGDASKFAKPPPSYESEYLARSRAIIRDYWETPEIMWEHLDILEAEYKGKE